MGLACPGLSKMVWDSNILNPGRILSLPKQPFTKPIANSSTFTPPHELNGNVERRETVGASPIKGPPRLTKAPNERAARMAMSGSPSKPFSSRNDRSRVLGADDDCNGRFSLETKSQVELLLDPILALIDSPQILVCCSQERDVQAERTGTIRVGRHSVGRG